PRCSASPPSAGGHAGFGPASRWLRSASPVKGKAHPRTMSTVAARAQAMPAICQPVRRSRRMRRARIMVVAGKSDERVTTPGSGPSRTAKRYRAWAPKSKMPHSAAILAIGRGMRRSSSRKRARPPKRDTVTTFIARSGQAPASCGVWARARKKTPQPTPEARGVAKSTGGRLPPAEAGVRGAALAAHQHDPRDRQPDAERGKRCGPLAGRDPHQHRDRDRGHRGRGRDDRHRPDRQRAVEKEDGRAGGQPGDGAPQEIVRRRQPRTGKRHERAEEDEPAELGYGDPGDGGGAAGGPTPAGNRGGRGQGGPRRGRKKA